ncbi:MAG: hypothetical protein ACKVOB_13455 [Sphingomonas sp.]
MSESDFRIVRPIEVTTAKLTSTTVPETVAAYNAGTSYSIGNQVRSDTTHRIYESLANANLGNALTDTTKWLNVGPTNPWAMFDQLNSSRTTKTDSIVVVIAPGDRVDTIGLLNLNATSVTVAAVDATDGTVFNQTTSLISTAGILDWYTYFTEPVSVAEDVIVTGLPPLYRALTFTITLSYTGQTVACGGCILGLAKVMGTTLAGATTGIVDYSTKTTDAFGNTSITARGFANKGNFRVFCANSNIVSIQRLLSDYRAVPALYVGTELYSTTFLYGFFRDFSISIEQPNHSYLSIEIEGLI